MKSTQGQNYKFLDDDDFCQLRNTLDNIMKDKTSKGLGMVVKKAQIITESEEELLWEKGFLGSSNPKQLVNTLLYLFGLNFALRASQNTEELYMLKMALGF